MSPSDTSQDLRTFTRPPGVQQRLIESPVTEAWLERRVLKMIVYRGGRERARLKNVFPRRDDDRDSYKIAEDRETGAHGTIEIETARSRLRRRSAPPLRKAFIEYGDDYC